MMGRWWGMGPGPRSPEPSFWDEECPERGGMLTHAHWNQCNPDGVHPGTDKQHTSSTCCHCGYNRESWKAEQAAIEKRLAEVNTGATEVQLTAPDPMTGCVIDHRSIEAWKMLLGDDGLEWKCCPRCGVTVEPKALSGVGPMGPHYGPGRGVMTERLQRKLEFIRWQFYSSDGLRLQP